VVPLQQFLPAALASALRRAPLTPDKVAFAWRSAVGAAVDRASAIELRGATLVVTVKSNEWRQEITRSSALIRSRLALVLGEGVVTRIAVFVGTDSL
jgi:hypothetical protein